MQQSVSRQLPTLRAASRMAGGVAKFLAAVARAGDDLPAPHDHAAHRRLPGQKRLPRQIERLAHPRFVHVRTPFFFIITPRFCLGKIKFG